MKVKWKVFLPHVASKNMQSIVSTSDDHLAGLWLTGLWDKSFLNFLKITRLPSVFFSFFYLQHVVQGGCNTTYGHKWILSCLHQRGFTGVFILHTCSLAEESLCSTFFLSGCTYLRPRWFTSSLCCSALVSTCCVVKLQLVSHSLISYLFSLNPPLQLGQNWFLFNLLLILYPRKLWWLERLRL